MVRIEDEVVNPVASRLDDTAMTADSLGSRESSSSSSIPIRIT